MTENRNYYKKKIILFLFVITTVFGIISLYQYYRVKIENPFQLLSAVLYGTIKLFLFAAPLSAEVNGGMMYEFAKWMAPILTSAFIFTQISNILLHSKNMILNRFSRNHVVLFGSGKMTETLIGNLKKEKKYYKISLVTKEFLDERLKNQYERKGIACYQLDLGKSDRNEIRELFTALCIENAKYLFFMAESDLENFSLYAGVIQRIKPKRAITAYVHSESGTVAGYMEELLYEERKKEADLKKLDTVHFKERLVQDSLLKSLSGVSGLSSSGENKERKSEEELLRDRKLSAEKIDKTIHVPHILLFGVNELSFPLLKQLANDATLSLKKKTKVTVLDENAGRGIAELFSIYGDASTKENPEECGGEKTEKSSIRTTSSCGLEMALEIESIELGAASMEALQKQRLENYLKAIGKDDAPTLIFLMDKDIIKSLKALNLINRYFENVPKLIRNVSQVDLTGLLPKRGGQIRSFGDISEILTEKVLIREALDKRAKAFNEAYNSLSGMGEGPSWNELSFVKKNSSRLSATHAIVKEEFLKRIFSEKSEAEIRALCREKLSEFSKLQEVQKENPEEFRKRFCSFLEENPVLDFLSRLEHKRWCNSYYAMGFRYGEKKDENRRTHPCLIEDWGEVIGEKFDICHPEYDLLSVFTLF